MLAAISIKAPPATPSTAGPTGLDAGRVPACPGAILPLLFLLTAPMLLAQAPIFPDQIGPYQKSAPRTVSVADRALYEEYGLESTESAEYATADAGPAKKRFSATAWRLHDSTGAMALFQFRRPAGATAADFARLAVRTSDGVVFAYGNYVLQITGGLPEQADLAGFYNQLPKFENSPLPALIDALPPEALVPNSGRYLLGPVSLQRFEPGIPPSTAAFRLGAEGQLGKYGTGKGELTLSIFAYPTPAMARDQALEFQKIVGAMVKRTGPLVAVTVNPPDADAAERLLGRINYQAQVTVNEKVPGSELRSFSRDIVSMILLAGIVIVFCVMAGLFYGGFRVLRRKVSNRDPQAMIVLDIGRSK